MNVTPRKPCSMPGCKNKHHNHGYCSMHWSRLLRRGSAEYVRIYPPGRVLLWIREVAIQFTGTECLNHPFATGSHGYGNVSINGETDLIHRYVCALVHGTCPQDKNQAAHSCGNKKCANPLHLRWATFSENQYDKLSYGKDNRGEKHCFAKLTEEKAREILSSPETPKALANKFGVSPGTVRSIKKRERWKWL